jgi:hypothetical protein
MQQEVKIHSVVLTGTRIRFSAKYMAQFMKMVYGTSGIASNCTDFIRNPTKQTWKELKE